jgi:DNA-binding transcriptional ArsR family regulator
MANANGDADIAAVAALIADRTRAAMLDALMDGRSCAAGELAGRVGVAPSTASGHLSRLLSGGLLSVETSGRERRYRLGSPAVATALEALSRVAPPQDVRSLRSADRGAAIREARTCYDHLAGRLGVDLTEALVRDDALVLRHTAYELTPRGAETMAGLGVDVAVARSRNRAFARACLDWSERRPHLAGELGAALLAALLDCGWLARRRLGRAVAVTPHGRDGLRGALGVDVEAVAPVALERAPLRRAA